MNQCRIVRSPAVDSANSYIAGRISTFNTRPIVMHEMEWVSLTSVDVR